MFILNKLGILRFIKIYSDDEHKLNKEDLIKRIFEYISSSKDTSVIFDFDYLGEKKKLVYRTYGSIYIIMIIDDLENELGILDFINLIMKILDEVFKGVTEKHIIMNPEKVYLLIDELISGGIVIETDKNEIVSNYNEKMKDS